MKSVIKNLVASLTHSDKSRPVGADAIEGARLFSGYSTLRKDEAECQLTRKTAGIFYADIVEYSRLTEEDEEGTHIRLVESMKTMEVLIDTNQGRVAHLAGDAVLAEFRDAESALRCAINVQLAAREWNANLARRSQIRFRIGVNFGQVISDRGDIYGKAVNLAARLEGLACSGGICVSEAVRQKLETSSEFSFYSIGQRYVKNIDKPVQAFWIELDCQETIEPKHMDVLAVTAATS